MAVADIIILSILLVSVLISIIRGFVREALSLAGWILAFWIAVKYAPVLDEKMVRTIQSDSLRFITAFIGLFLATILASVIVNKVLAKIVHAVGLGGTDRMLGMMFGAMRGVLILCVLVFAAQMVSLNKQRWWKESQLVGHLESLNEHLVTEQFKKRLQQFKEQIERARSIHSSAHKNANVRIEKVKLPIALK